METEFIIQAIEGGAWPVVGAVAIVLSWLLSKFRHQTPIAEQLKHAGVVALGALPWALSAGGAALVAGIAPLQAAGLALGVLLMQAGFTVPRRPTPPKDSEPKAKVSTTMLVLCASLAVGSVGCSQLLSGVAKVAQVAQVAQWMGSVVDSAQAGADTYFARHPNQIDEQSVAVRMRQIRRSLAKLNAAAAGAESSIEESQAKTLQHYEALLDELERTGVQDARAPEGGAEGYGPIPVPLTLPSADEFAARM